MCVCLWSDPELRQLHFRVSRFLSGSRNIFNRGVPPPLPRLALRWDSSVCWDVARSLGKLWTVGEREREKVVVYWENDAITPVYIMFRCK